MNQTGDLERTLDAGLKHLSKQHGAHVPTASYASLLHYVHLLAKWNRVYNLTAVRDANDMIQRHLLDSLVLCRWLPEHSQSSEVIADVVDIGSGAGLPVLPLAIARPDLSFVSVESNGKKTRFQQQVLVELQLTNVDIRHERVQSSVLQGEFVTSRAFTAPLEFLQIADSLCTDQATVALMLAHTEHLPARLPGSFCLQEMVPLDIPGSAGPRHIALCRRRCK